MTTHIDINCDMGESYGRWTLGHDEEVMPNITSANIACARASLEPAPSSPARRCFATLKLLTGRIAIVLI